MLFLYIDPGTGSMFFAILVGIMGAFTYLLKNWMVKLRFLFAVGYRLDKYKELTAPKEEK